jgi:hypothetical protein
MNDDRLVGLKRQRPCQKRLSTRGGIVKLFENDCGAVDVSVPWPSFNLRRRVWRGLATVIHHHADCRQRCPTQHTTFQRHCEPLFPTGLRACRQSKAQQPHFCRWRTPRRREHGRHRPLTNPGRQRQCTLVRQRTVGNGRTARTRRCDRLPLRSKAVRNIPERSRRSLCVRPESKGSTCRRPEAARNQAGCRTWLDCRSAHREFEEALIRRIRPRSCTPTICQWAHPRGC